MHTPSAVRRLHIGYADGAFTLTEDPDQSDLITGLAIIIGANSDDVLVACFDEVELARRNHEAALGLRHKGV